VDDVEVKNGRSETGQNGDASTPHDIHDLTYRRVFEASPMVVQLIQSFIHEKWVEKVDATHIRPVNSDFVTPFLESRETDLLYEVDIQGKKVLFCIMIELQSTVDYLMAFRILEYQMLYWKQKMKNISDDEKKRKSFRMPYIVPIVLYNGEARWTAETKLRKLFVGEELFGEKMLNFEYHLIDVNRFPEKQLLSLENAIGTVFLLDQARTRKTDHFFYIMAEMMPKLNDEGQGYVGEWVEGKILNGRKYMKMFRKNMESGEPIMSGIEMWAQDRTNEGIAIGYQRGIEQGIEQGIEKGAERFAKRMIKNGFSLEIIAMNLGLSLSRVEQIYHDMMSGESKV
jgi:predicted transposase/invertase (TIGR01784 family)